MTSRAFAFLSLLAAGCALSTGPAPEAQQLRLRDREDVAGMRAHGWALLARVTRREEGRPAWEGWHPIQQAFGGGERRFRLVEEPESVGIPLRQASGAPLMSLVMFNGPAYRHIRSRRLFRRATLERINAGFGAAAPVARRRIAPFPRDSMSMKLIWTIVHAGGPTPVSVWDGAGGRADGNPPELWPRVVLVDPGRTQVPEGETRTVTLGGRTYRDMRVVPLDRFYHVPVGAAEIEAVRAIDPTARIGDHAALLGIHLTTREIPDWVWATFWWHDRPQEGAFAAGRPPAVTGPWRNYLMDVAYSMESPAEADGTPNVAFNPYVEVFAGGLRSNCMTCHQGAVWTAGGAAPFLPVTRGARRPDDPLFRAGTRLDFMWSIAEEAR